MYDFSWFCSGMIALGFLFLNPPLQAATVLPVNGNGVSHIEYHPDRDVIAVSIDKWPKEGHIFLSGIDAVPTAAGLNAGHGKTRNLKLVMRAEGWYIFLPPAPPRSGMNEVLITVADPPKIKEPVTRFNTDNELVLTPDNGWKNGNGRWSWRVKCLNPGTWIALLTNGGNNPASLAVNGKQELFSDAASSAWNGVRVLGMACISSRGIHEITLSGVPEKLEKLELRLADIRKAVLRLPGNTAEIKGTGLRISGDGTCLCNWNNPDDFAVWTRPLLLPGRYLIMGEFSSEKDSSLTLDSGTRSASMEIRATGSWNRFQRVPLGTIELTGSGIRKFIVRAVKKYWNPVNLREVTLYPEALAEQVQADKLIPLPDPLEIQGKNRFIVPLGKAVLAGKQIRLNPQIPCITNWHLADDYLLWHLEGVKPGRYRVRTSVATMGNSCLHVSAGAGTATAGIPNTGSYENFQTIELGELSVTRMKDVRLTVFALPGEWSPVNLGNLEFERILE